MTQTIAGVIAWTFRAAVVSAFGAVLGGCVEKPASEPTATINFRVEEGALEPLDAHLGAYAEGTGFRYAGGLVGANDQTIYTMHFVRSDMQIIGVDSFVGNCFRLSFYKTVRFNAASDADIARTKAEVEDLLRRSGGVVLLNQQEANQLGW